MIRKDMPSHFALELALYGAVTLAGFAGCDAGRASSEAPGVRAAQRQRETGGTVGITLDQTSPETGLNGTYGDGQRSLRFETVRQPMDRGALHPPLPRDYYIALRVMDSTGRTLLTLSEDKLPSQWAREEQPEQGRELPVEPELFRVALEAAQAVRQLKLPRDLQPEQALLVQQLSLFGSHPLRQPPGGPPARGGP